MYANPDIIIISQSNMVDYRQYSRLDLSRLELFQTMVYPRMIHFKTGFRSHLDIFNFLKYGNFYSEVDFPQRRSFFNIWNLPGYSGLHLANYLLAFDIKPVIINNLDSEWDLFCALYRNCDPPPPVAISTTFYLSYPEIKRLTSKIKTEFPEVELILGGAFINEQSINKGVETFEAPMRKYGISHVLHAFNSEPDLRDFLLARKSGGGLHKTKNLCSLVEGRFRATESKWRNPLLNELPSNWDKIESPAINSSFQFRTVSGCPYSCAFCSYPETAGGYHRMDVDMVRQHLDAICANEKLKNIIFIDDTFNAGEARFTQLCKLFCEYEFSWYAFIRAHLLTEDSVKVMADSGCKAVYLGIESANDFILQNMNKKSKISDHARGIGLLKKYGITTVAAFVLGFPGENRQSIKNNIAFIENSGIDFYSLKEFYYMEHTSIHTNREQFGLTGGGNRWKHDTMDSHQASENKIEMFQRIKNSISIDPDTSLWYLAYLIDRGYEAPMIKQMQSCINNLMREQLTGSFNDQSQEYGILKNLLVKD